MDPNTGRIYAQDEIDKLPPEIQERLVHGTREELEELQKHIVRREAEELIEILDAIEEVKEMPSSPEQFYPVNRAARRKAEKRDRALKKRKPNGKT